MVKTLKAARSLIKTVIGPWKLLGHVPDLASLGSKVVFYHSYIDARYPMSLCEGKSLTGTSRIVNCASTFEVAEPLSFLAPGARVPMNLTAFDEEHRPTPLPAKLVFEPASVLSEGGPFVLDPNSLIATGRVPGMGGVKVIDEATGATVTWGIATVIPHVWPEAATIKAGDTGVTLRLVPRGLPDKVLHLPVGISVKANVSDPDVVGCVVLPIVGMRCLGRQPGEATVELVEINTGESFGAAKINVEQASDFWEGTYTLTNCNVPDFAGSGGARGPCSYVMFPPVGNTQSDSGYLQMRTGSTEAGNVRWSYSVYSSTPGICTSAGSGVDVGVAPSFSRPLDLRGTFFVDGNTSTNAVFTVVERTSTRIAGTFSATFEYPSTTGRARGTASGVWAVSLRATPFPKCTYDAPASYCQYNGTGYQIGVGSVGTCDWRAHTGAARPGEWQGIP